VKAGNPSLKPELPPHLVEHQEGGDLLDPGLDAVESDEVVVELGELVVDPLLEHELVD
jgi:hypothetical protein